MAFMEKIELKFPFFALIVSGGHTEFALCEGVGVSKYTVIGQCLDDAIGEAFDKVWRLLLECLKRCDEVEPEQISKWQTIHPGQALVIKFSLLIEVL